MSGWTWLVAWRDDDGLIHSPRLVADDGEPILEASAGRVVDLVMSEPHAHLLRTPPELLAALIETFEAARLAARMLLDAGLSDEFIERGHAMGIRDGFGMRAKAAIAKAQGK